MSETLNTETGEYENVKSKKRSYTDIDDIIEWLEEKYFFRFNEISCKPEWVHASGKNQTFKSIDDYMLNSIVVQMKQAKLKVSKQLVSDLISSEFAPKVNPIKLYFNSLEWDKTDHIQTACDSLGLVHPEKFKKYFTKWLVACLANVFQNGAQNQTCLVLTGGQGKGKTTFLNNLCPKDLDLYLFCGKIEVENKDTLSLLAENFILNIDDQLRTINKKDEDALKSIISLNEVKYRRSYDKYITTYPRIANFCASVNDNQFLADPTGNRRFLPFEVTGIDRDKVNAINIPQMWAQAMELYRAKFHYKFLDEEIDQLNEYNSEFQIQTEETHLIMRKFRKPTSKDFELQLVEYLTTSDIMQILRAEFKTQNISMKKVGATLKQLELTTISRRVNGLPVKCYPVVQITFEEMQEERRGGGNFMETVEKAEINTKPVKIEDEIPLNKLPF